MRAGLAVASRYICAMTRATDYAWTTDAVAAATRHALLGDLTRLVSCARCVTHDALCTVCGFTILARHGPKNESSGIAVKIMSICSKMIRP